MKKEAKKYSLDRVNDALYGDEVFKNIWGIKEQEAEQLFLRHSDEQPNMFSIPSLWAPIVKHLMEELVKVDPGIRFLQVKEKLGGLRVYTKPSAMRRDLIHHMIYGAAEAVDTVTLVQLRMIDRMKNDTTKNST